MNKFTAKIELLLARLFGDLPVRHRCDMCQGMFPPPHDLFPISGDWWLCEECLDRYMNESVYDGEDGA